MNIKRVLATFAATAALFAGAAAISAPANAAVNVDVDVPGVAHADVHKGHVRILLF